MITFFLSRYNDCTKKLLATPQEDMYRLTNFHRFGSFHVNHPPSQSSNNSNSPSTRGAQSCVGQSQQQHQQAPHSAPVQSPKSSNNMSLLRSMSFRNNIGTATSVVTQPSGGGGKSYKTEATFQPVQPRRISNTSVGISSIIFGDENQAHCSNPVY